MHKLPNDDDGSNFDGKEAARRAADQFHQYLKACHGGQVPEKEVEAFEKLYAAAWPYADQLETALTAVRASARDRQRERVSTRLREPQIPAYPNRDRPSDTLPASTLCTFAAAARRMSLTETRVRKLVAAGDLDTFEYDGRAWIHPKTIADYQRRAERRGAGR